MLAVNYSSYHHNKPVMNGKGGCYSKLETVVTQTMQTKIPMKKISILAFITIITFACESGKKTEGEETAEEKPVTKYSLKKDMIGEWRNVAMKVTIKGEEADSVVDVPAGKWEEVLQIQPIRTVYSEDGTYNSEYRDLDDSIIMTSAGTWSVKGDTLIMTEQGKTNYYITTVKEGMAEFDGYVDWDEDGQADDHYWGKQKKQE